MTSMTRLGLVIAAGLLFGVGCGDEQTCDADCGTGGGDTTGSGGSGGTGGGTAEPMSKYGIQGCAAEFVDDEGLCRPAIEKCPAGQIPKFDEGCVPVGIAQCAPAFLEEDGQCHVTMEKCPAGTFPVPSEGCVPIDGPEGCGDGTWGPITDAPNTIWVDPAYAGDDGDGSKDKPVKTIAAALDLAPKDGRIALAAGEYAEPIVPKQPVEIVGRCPSMVKVTGTAHVLDFDVAVSIRDMLGMVTIRRIQVGGEGFGINIKSTDVTLDRVWVKGVRGLGIGAHGVGTDLKVTNSLVQDVRSKLDASAGEGIDSNANVTVTVEKTAVVGTRYHGFAAIGANSKLNITDSVVEKTAVREKDGVGGYAIVSASGGEVVVDNSAAVEGTVIGALVEPDAQLTMKNSVIEKTQPGTEYGIGYGVEVYGGGEMNLSGVAVLKNIGAGLVVSDAKSKLIADRILVQGTLPRPTDKDRGVGASAVDKGAITVTNSAFIGNTQIGLDIDREGSATLTSVLVQDTKLHAAASVDGIGVVVRGKASATINGSASVKNRTTGFFVGEGCKVTMANDLVEGTTESPTQGLGAGIWFAGAAEATLSAAAILDTRAAGVLVRGGVASVDASLIRGVLEGTLIRESETIVGLGDGVLVANTDPGADVSVTSTHIEACARAGVLFASGSGALRGSTLAKNRYGVVLQGAAAVEVGEDNTFVGNTEKDRLEGGTLPTP